MNLLVVPNGIILATYVSSAMTMSRRLMLIVRMDSFPHGKQQATYPWESRNINLEGISWGFRWRKMGSLTKTDAKDEWAHHWLWRQRSVNSWVVGACAGNLWRAQLRSDTKNMPSNASSCCQPSVETINMDRVGRRKRRKEDLICLVWYGRSCLKFHPPIHRYRTSKALKERKKK